LKVLFIGDVVGQTGRNAVSQILPELKEKLSPVFVIANGENAAGGVGITKDTANDLFYAGVNVLTMGNHVWAKKESYTFIDNESRLIRPANYPDGAPGRGWNIFQISENETIAVINLCGRVFMESLDNPFLIADSIVKSIGSDANAVFIDFHAEATSEKCAMGLYMDGKASAVVGTHTHVQTADECILPKGTGYITDAGMTGPIDSVIGVKSDIIISKFLTQMPGKFEIADGRAIFSAVVIDIDSKTGKADKIERIYARYDKKYKSL